MPSPLTEGVRLPSALQFDLGCISTVMDSPHDDPELLPWLRWASTQGNTPMFVRTVAEAALMACSPDYDLLRPMPLELKRRHPGGWTASRAGHQTGRPGWQSYGSWNSRPRSNVVDFKAGRNRGERHYSQALIPLTPLKLVSSQASIPLPRAASGAYSSPIHPRCIAVCGSRTHRGHHPQEPR